MQASTGQHWETTSFRMGPMFLHRPVASMGAMLLVPIGIMSALVARDRTGRGQHVEVSLCAGRALAHDAELELDRPGQFSLAKTHPPGIHQPSIFECANGEWIHARGDGRWSRRRGARRRSSASKRCRWPTCSR